MVADTAQVAKRAAGGLHSFKFGLFLHGSAGPARLEDFLQSLPIGRLIGHGPALCPSSALWLRPAAWSDAARRTRQARGPRPDASSARPAPPVWAAWIEPVPSPKAARRHG